MSNVQLQVRPRRVRCSTACEPPPFRFEAVDAPERATGVARLAQAPFRAAWLVLAGVGMTIDAIFFLVVITTWCALHLTVWSYAFEIGPAASCFGLPCPEWLRARVALACAGLAVLSLLAAIVMRRLGHRATGAVLLLLLTFDLAALLLLGIRSVA